MQRSRGLEESTLRLEVSKHTIQELIDQKHKIKQANKQSQGYNSSEYTWDFYISIYRHIFISISISVSSIFLYIYINSFYSANRGYILLLRKYRIFLKNSHMRGQKGSLIINLQRINFIQTLFSKDSQ